MKLMHLIDSPFESELVRLEPLDVRSNGAPLTYLEEHDDFGEETEDFHNLISNSSKTLFNVFALVTHLMRQQKHEGT